jgi:hypothetical protein
MANSMFRQGRLGLLDATIQWLNGTMQMALVKGYTPALTSHKFLSDVTGAGGTVANPTVLTAKTVALSGSTIRLNAATVTFASSPNDVLNNYALLVYQSSGPTGGADVADSAKRLVAYWDVGTNMPINPLGTSFSVSWTTALMSAVE